MAEIGPPRCGAKPVPKMTPASHRSASVTIFSRRQATASLSAGITSGRRCGFRSTRAGSPLAFWGLPFTQV